MLDKQSLFGRHSGLDDAVSLLTLLAKRAGAVCLLKRAFVETQAASLKWLGRSALARERVSAWVGQTKGLVEVVWGYLQGLVCVYSLAYVAIQFDVLGWA